MNKYVRIGLIVLISLILIIQFFPVDKSVPETPADAHLLSMHVPSDDVHHIFKNACLDCHSYDTRYPWYANIAPVSWWLQGHINDARDEMNFSVWKTYDPDERDHMLEECIELVKEDKMPLTSYTIIHREADLEPAEKQLLTSWFSSIRQANQTRGEKSKPRQNIEEQEEEDHSEHDDDH